MVVPGLQAFIARRVVAVRPGSKVIADEIMFSFRRRRREFQLRNYCIRVTLS